MAPIPEDNNGASAVEDEAPNGKVDGFADDDNAEAQAQQRQSKHSLFGITCILTGVFLAAVMFLLVKLLADRASTFTLLFYRGAVQVALSLLAVRRSRGQRREAASGSDWDGNPLGPPEVRWLLALRAMLGSAAVCAWFWGCQVLPLPDAVTLQFTSPPFAAAFAVCLVGEPWLPRDIIGAAVCLAGVALIAHPTWLFGASRGEAAVGDNYDGKLAAKGSDLALQALGATVTTAGAALAGLAYVLVRVIGDRASALVMVLYYGAVSMPVAVLGSIFFEGNWNVFTIRGGGNSVVRDAALILLVGVLGHVAQWLLNLGLQREAAATATLATCTQIVWTYIFELAFLHEGLNRWSVAGSGLILGYMLVVAFAKMKDASIPDDVDGDPPTKVEKDENVISEETPLMSTPGKGG